MKKNVYSNLFVAILCLVIDGGCTPISTPEGETLETDPTNTPVLRTTEMATEAVFVATATATPEPVPTLSPTATATYAPPPQLPEAILSNLLFNGTPDCQLPCWQGLTPGESSSDDIQAVFSEVFGFGEERDVFSGPIPSSIRQLPGLDTAVQTWHLAPYFLEVILYVDEDTSTLTAILIDWSTVGTVLVEVTPQQFLRQLGTPSSMTVLIDEYSGTFQARMEYGQGVIYSVSNGALFSDIDRTSWPPTGDGGMCLNEASRGIVLLIDPSAGAEVREVLFRETNLFVDERAALHVEDAFGITLEELTELAIEEENPCLFADVSLFYP